MVSITHLEHLGLGLNLTLGHPTHVSTQLPRCLEPNILRRWLQTGYEASESKASPSGTKDSILTQSLRWLRSSLNPTLKSLRLDLGLTLKCFITNPNFTLKHRRSRCNPILRHLRSRLEET